MTRKHFPHPCRCGHDASQSAKTWPPSPSARKDSANSSVTMRGNQNCFPTVGSEWFRKKTKKRDPDTQSEASWLPRQARAMFGSCKHNHPPSPKGRRGGAEGHPHSSQIWGPVGRGARHRLAILTVSGEEVNSVAFWNERPPFTVFVSQLLSAKVSLEVPIQVRAVRKRSAVNKRCRHVIR